MQKNEEWLKLADASRVLGVSEITLRRRVRSGKIKTKFEDGKYLVCVNKESFIAQPQPSSPVLPKTSSFIKTSTERVAEQLHLELHQLRARNEELEPLVLQQRRQIEDQQTLIKILEDGIQ